MKRIMKEISNINNNPHPNFKIFPTANDYAFWKIVLVGPENTPYEKVNILILY